MAKKTILVVLGYLDGLGDFGLALKWVEQIKAQYKQRGEDVDVYIVTDDNGKRIIQDVLDGEREFSTKAINSVELNDMLNKDLTVDGIIAASLVDPFVSSDVDRAFEGVIEPIPLIYVPEAATDLADLTIGTDMLQKLKNIKLKKAILSGFAENEAGILLSNALTHPLPVATSIRNISPKIMHQLLGAENDSDDILDEQFNIYRENTTLSVQYSNRTDEKPSGSSRFLQIHREFYRQIANNQDVILVGGIDQTKKADLVEIVAKLVQDGFTSISFINADTKQKEVLYTADPPREPKKEYRAIYTSGVPHPSMIALYSLSGSLAGGRGDCSFFEAISADKIVLYEDVLYKPGRVLKPYHDALSKAANDDAQILQTLELLRTAKEDEAYQQLGLLLRTPGIKDSLISLNAQIKRRYDLSLPVYKSLSEQVNPSCPSAENLTFAAAIKWKEIGDYLFKSGRLSNAIEVYQKAVDIYQLPRFINKHLENEVQLDFDLMIAYFEKERYSEAVEMIINIIVILRDCPECSIPSERKEKIRLNLIKEISKYAEKCVDTDQAEYILCRAYMALPNLNVEEKRTRHGLKVIMTASKNIKQRQSQAEVVAADECQLPNQKTPPNGLGFFKSTPDNPEPPQDGYGGIQPKHDP